MLSKDAALYIAGENTLIGAGIIRECRRQGFTHLLPTAGCEPDLTCKREVEDFFVQHKPQYVILAAGRSGGIQANQAFPAELMLDNLLVSTHLLDAAHRHGVRKLLYLASSCSYPKHCPQPMAVDQLMTGPLEPTNEAYATAKLAGLVLCKAYRQQYGSAFMTGIPANAFGPGDDFDPANSHVIAALLRRMHEAKVAGTNSLEIWGTGMARREFIFVEDLARACLLALERYEGEPPINLGSGTDVSIQELAECIREVVGYEGALVFNHARPDGMPEKRLAAAPLAALGWQPQIPFREALAITYQAYLASLPAGVIP